MKKEFLYGLLTGCAITASLPTMALANQWVSALRTPQTIILDGESMDWTVYNVLDENYIRLADLCPELGVGLVWDPVANAVRMNSDGTTPDITPETISYTPSPTQATIPFPMPDLSYYPQHIGEDLTSHVNAWANMAVYGILDGYLNMDTTDYILGVTDASLIGGNGQVLFWNQGNKVEGVNFTPVSSFSDLNNNYMDVMTFIYVLETKGEETLMIRLDVAGDYPTTGATFSQGSLKILASCSTTPDYFYRAYSDDGGFYLLFREEKEDLNTNVWDFPAYHYGAHVMTDGYLMAIMGEDNQIIEWRPME